MFKYFIRRTKIRLRKYLETRVVILQKKQILSSDLSPWREDFFNEVVKKVTNDVKTVLEIGDGDGALSYKLSKKYDDRFFYGIDVGLEPFKKNNYCHLNMNATELLFQDNFFDLIISHNVFEHIHGLEEAVNEAIRVLKPGGKFYAFFAPIWTSAYGHHFYKDTGEKVSSEFPPFCHLYVSGKDMAKLIKKKVGYFSEGRIQAEEYLIGGCNNKLLPEDYRNIFKSRMNFRIIKFNEITEHHHNNININVLPKNLLDRYGTMPKQDFQVVGFEIEGLKL